MQQKVLYIMQIILLILQQKTLNAVNLARSHMYGGGTITWSASYYLKWTARIVAIGIGKGSHFSTDGYFQIAMPGSGNTISKYNGGTVSVTTDGIPLAAWETLYYLLPIGSGNASSLSNFIIYPYNVSQEIPNNAVMIAMRSGDNNYLYLFNNIRIAAGSSTNY